MSGAHRLVGALRLLATVSALVAGEAVLHLAGRVLPPLPLDATRLTRTFDEAEPLALAVSALRLVALGVGAALLVVTVAGITARAMGSVKLVTKVDRWTPRSLRRLLDGALGAGLAVSIGMSAMPAGADPAPPTPTLRRLGDGPSPKPGGADPVTTLRRLPDAAPPPAQPASDPSTGAAPAAPVPAPITPQAAAPIRSPMADGRREVTVRPGDSFWRLAERYEAERLGRRPSESEVGARWQELVAINRHRLIVPGDADLLFPGQVLQLPAS